MCATGAAVDPDSATPTSHLAIDACSRLAYSEVHANERATTAVGFWRRALAFFASYGITVERVLTDNGACHEIPPT